MESPTDAGFGLTVVLMPEQFEALARRVAALIEEGRDDGFLDVEGAAAYLCTTPAAIQRKVARGQIPHHRAGGRVLFNRRELRDWVEAGR